MGSKIQPGLYDCYAAALPDEPLFVLRANDPLAPAVVNTWINHRIQQILQGIKPNTEESWAKVSEALKCRDAMIAWFQKTHLQGEAEDAKEASKLN